MKFNRYLFIAGIVVFVTSFFINSVNLHGLLSTELKGYKAFLAAVFLEIESDKLFHAIHIRLLGISNILILASPFFIKRSLKARSTFLAVIYLFIVLQLSLAITTSLDNSPGFTLSFGFYLWNLSYSLIALSLIDYSSIKMFNRNPKT